MSLLGWRKRRPTPPQTIGLYYASDVHGSEKCWRKFLAAANFYGVDTLIMGGDLTGKAIVPVYAEPGGSFSATFAGERRWARNSDQLEDLLAAIRFNGMYPWQTDHETAERLRADSAGQAALFEQVMTHELGRWVQLADERLAGNDTVALTMPGNDDPWYIDEILKTSTRLRFCDDQLVEVGPHEIISCSYANPTPWNSPRELEEQALYNHLRALAEQVTRPDSAIFNFHVPPYDTGLDMAIELNEDLTPVLRGGAPHEIPVGSHAVREIIEEFQPALALHGHIHESRNEKRLGRTLCLNPGSNYNSGRIDGIIATLWDGLVVSHQFVNG